MELRLEPMKSYSPTGETLSIHSHSDGTVYFWCSEIHLSMRLDAAQTEQLGKVLHFIGDAFKLKAPRIEVEWRTRGTDHQQLFIRLDRHIWVFSPQAISEAWKNCIHSEMFSPSLRGSRKVRELEQAVRERDSMIEFLKARS